jgi:hypothetical protein
LIEQSVCDKAAKATGCACEKNGVCHGVLLKGVFNLGNSADG